MELSEPPAEATPIVACTFGYITTALNRLKLKDVRREAKDRLDEIADDIGDCLATTATGVWDAAREDLSCRPSPWS